MKVRKRYEPTLAEYALALTLYRDGQERIKWLLRKELRKHNKPSLSLEEVRAILDKKMGNSSLSQMVIEMRKESQ